MGDNTDKDTISIPNSKVSKKTTSNNMTGYEKGK